MLVELPIYTSNKHRARLALIFLVITVLFLLFLYAFKLELQSWEILLSLSSCYLAQNKPNGQIEEYDLLINVHDTQIISK